MPAAERRLALRVVVADDAPLIRQGVTAVLTDAGLQVVASVGNAADLLEAVSRCQPEVAITDVRMPPGQGLEGLAAAVTMQQQFPAMGILVLSNHAETRYLATLLEDARAGVGYLLKERVIDTEDFVAAVRRVAAGGTALDPDIVGLLLARRSQRLHIKALTAREHDVLAQMATGASNAAISGALHLSPKTVESHVQHIFAKLNMAEDPDENRRVKAVLTFLQGS